MTRELQTQETDRHRWTEVTKALLLGFIGLNVLLHQSFIRGVGFVPDGASQLMMWVAVVGIVSYAVLRHDLTAGYWLSFLTGVLFLVFVGIIGSGLLGPLPSGGPLIGFVLGPVAQVVYAIVLIGSTYMALRERDKTEMETMSSERTPEAH